MSGSAPIGESIPHPRMPSLRADSPVEGPLELRSQETDDGALIVTVVGDVDTVAAERFAEFLRERLATTASRTVVLDLSGVALLSTAGVVVLMELSHRTFVQDRPLVLVTENRNVDRVLSVVGVDSHFDKAATVSAAREHPTLEPQRSG